MPFIVAYNPVLLLHGELVTIILAVLTAVIGVSALSFAIEGVTFHFQVPWWERVIYAICALLLIIPGGYTDTMGLVGIIVLYFIGLRTHPSVWPKSVGGKAARPT